MPLYVDDLYVGKINTLLPVLEQITLEQGSTVINNPSNVYINFLDFDSNTTSGWIQIASNNDLNGLAEGDTHVSNLDSLKTFTKITHFTMATDASAHFSNIEFKFKNFTTKHTFHGSDYLSSYTHTANIFVNGNGMENIIQVGLIHVNDPNNNSVNTDFPPLNYDNKTVDYIDDGVNIYNYNFTYSYERDPWIEFDITKSSNIENCTWSGDNLNLSQINNITVTESELNEVPNLISNKVTTYEPFNLNILSNNSLSVTNGKIIFICFKSPYNGSYSNVTICPSGDLSNQSNNDAWTGRIGFGIYNNIKQDYISGGSTGWQYKNRPNDLLGSISNTYINSNLANEFITQSFTSPINVIKNEIYWIAIGIRSSAATQNSRLLINTVNYLFDNGYVLETESTPFIGTLPSTINGWLNVVTPSKYSMWFHLS